MSKNDILEQLTALSGGERQSVLAEFIGNSLISFMGWDEDETDRAR